MKRMRMIVGPAKGRIITVSGPHALILIEAKLAEEVDVEPEVETAVEPEPEVETAAKKPYRKKPNGSRRRNRAYRGTRKPD